MGLISGRKAFQRPLKEGVEILNAIQDVYLDNAIDVALILLPFKPVLTSTGYFFTKNLLYVLVQTK